jgi:large subunit ribosomal protein L18
MNRISQKLQNMARRKYRIRATVSGTTERPRLSVFVSHKHISAQLIDDTKHHTIAQISTVGAKAAKGTMTERAEVKTVVFDRGGRKYHGRIKALADAARAGGLEF